MSLGFTFKNVHSSTYGVAQSGERPARPPVKQSYIDMPHKNGSVDFTEIYGIHYEDSIFIVKLQITAENIIQLKTKVKQAAVWLTGSGTLVFDDEPEQEYSASCYEGLNYVPQIMGRYAELTINFRVKPWIN